MMMQKKIFVPLIILLFLKDKMKKLTLELINDMVWKNKWEGKVDDLALYERIRELLGAEIELEKLRKRVEDARLLFHPKKSGF